MGRRLLILGGCAVLLAGCGGKKHEAGNLYRLAPTAKCLGGRGFSVSTQEKDVNFIAYSAPGGGLRARKRGADLILAFGHSAKDRHQLMLAVKRFARRPPIFRYRIGRANVVIMWAYHPSGRNEKLLLDCLNESVA